jgi:hypothetical protein
VNNKEQQMNDRIKTMWEEATFKVWPRPGKFTAGEYDIHLEKFAELIVAECLGIVDDAERGGSNDIWDNAVKFIRRDLQEHFGVES